MILDAQDSRRRTGTSHAFTLIELLVVISVVGLLASLLLPALSRAKKRGYQAQCVSNLRQIGLGFAAYVDDHNDRYPREQALKNTLPGGYRPWASWPPSDPRAGWAAIVLRDYCQNLSIWSCRGSQIPPLVDAVQCRQAINNQPDAAVTHYWLWRFDRPDFPVPLDNFWNKNETQIIDDLRLANNPQIGQPTGPSDVELAVDPYFPNTIPTVAEELRGHAAHSRGRNRLFMDGHCEFTRDARLR